MLAAQEADDLSIAELNFDEKLPPPVSWLPAEKKEEDDDYARQQQQQ